MQNTVIKRTSQKSSGSLLDTKFRLTKNSENKNAEIQFGKLIVKINADGYFSISNDRSTITLHENGKINIHSNDDLILNSNHNIHLNTPEIEQ